jgi:hypothetical protein
LRPEAASGDRSREKHGLTVPAGLLAGTLAALALLVTAAAAPDPVRAAPARKPRPVQPEKRLRPRVYVELARVEAAGALERHRKALRAALAIALDEEPLTVTAGGLGLKSPTARRLRRVLRRRRLRGYALEVSLAVLSHRLRPGSPRRLEAEARLELSLRRLRRRGRRRKRAAAQPAGDPVVAQVSVPVSVVLRAEVLAIRQAALEAAARQAVVRLLRRALPRRLLPRRLHARPRPRPGARPRPGVRPRR